jgi:hypothetical protein
MKYWTPTVLKPMLPHPAVSPRSVASPNWVVNTVVAQSPVGCPEQFAGPGFREFQDFGYRSRLPPESTHSAAAALARSRDVSGGVIVFCNFLERNCCSEIIMFFYEIS